MIILDTNVLSALMRREERSVPIAWLDRQPWPSIWTTSITLCEIRFGVLYLPAGRRRDAVASSARQVIDDALGNRIAFFDAAAAEAAAEIMAKRRTAGRMIEIRDTFIAGIVLSRRATLATRNVRHFADVNIPLLDPWSD
jgi:predicted nucleic acid-binding protein